MTVALWIAAAAAAAGLSAWAYVWREERVVGRTGPGVLRGLVLFLILAGLWLPTLRSDAPDTATRIVLLDVSRSMSLPVRPTDGAEAGVTRFDSALTVAASLDAERLHLFGDVPASVPVDTLSVAVPDAERSRLTPALEAAQLGGADSVWVVTDGEWDDRAEALRTAVRLGLGVRELRVAETVPRLGIAAVLAPERARAGDTVRVEVDVRAGGPEITRTVAADPAADSGADPGAESVDSVRLELRLGGVPRAFATVPVPSAGRSVRAELALVPTEPPDESAWRRYEIALLDGVDPYGAADTDAIWMEVSEASSGAVLISTDPDWEARFLLPGLDRLVLGGVRGFLRLTDGRYLEMGPRPRLIDDVGRIQRAIRGARLLVVQTDLSAVPGWLESALLSHPRKLVLPRGQGSLPGTGLVVSGPLPGEWYPMPPVPPSPAASLLADTELDRLPPLREVYGVDLGTRWTILNANRSRRGEARPLLVAHERGSERWALATGAEWWRWAFRGGAPRRVYEGILSGLVGWLVEDVAPRPVSLSIPSRARRLAWRVRPSVRDLRIDVLTTEGDTVWSDEWAEPPEDVAGPTLEAGLHRIFVSGRAPDGTFRTERPIEVGPDRRELVPRAVPEPAVLAAAPVERVRSDARSRRPLWPFVLAMLLLCGEWIWRHRIGLR
jgi:hypothetical protein